MTKQFCDKCGTEITKSNQCIGGVVSEKRLGSTIVFRRPLGTTTREHKLNVELMHTFDGITNAGDFCKYCIIEAFNKLDDRPKLAKH